MVKGLEQAYVKACNDYIQAFAKHYDVTVDNDDWVAGDVGGTICINDEFFLNMEEIRFMLKNNMSWEAFLDWWDYCLDCHYLGLDSMNLRSWFKGAPRHTKEARDKIRKAKKELEDLIKEENEKKLSSKY